MVTTLGDWTLDKVAYPKRVWPLDLDGWTTFCRGFSLDLAF